jgi:prevent-host-death family protein
MINVPLAQAKNQLSELISRVEAGETVAVTRRGKPVARLVQCEGESASMQKKQVAQAFSRLTQLRRGVTLEGDLKALAREGLA